MVVFELLSAESEGFELAFELLLFLVALLELVVAFGHLFHGDFEQGGGMVFGFGEAFDFSLDGVSLGDVGLFVTELFFSAVFAFARRVELLFGTFETLPAGYVNVDHRNHPDLYLLHYLGRLSNLCARNAFRRWASYPH